MILAFTLRINGKLTYFVEKIHKGIRENYMLPPIDPSKHYTPDYNYIAKNKMIAKLHTIREDKTDRWKSGMKIDFFINVRQKNMFRFAPVLPVVSTQKFAIIYYSKEEYLKGNIQLGVAVRINNRRLDQFEVLELAKNDGFDTIEEFFEYFNQDFKGKIIHWTDKKY